MPQNFSEVLYDPNWPYHFHYDNLPLSNIYQQLDIMNFAIDQNTVDLRESIGSQGSLSYRLSQSLNDDGSLKAEAVDATMHDIGAHTEGSGFVIMTDDERAKLGLIADEATALQLQFPGISNIVLFDDEVVQFANSDTITWTVTAPNQVKGHMAFPLNAAHEHNYGLVPPTTDNINFKTTTINTPFIEDTLRVYINGVRIFSDIQVYVPDSSYGAYYLTTFTADYAAGTFVLNRVLDGPLGNPTDAIRIDFDTDFS